jgi:hypothetical protein
MNKIENSDASEEEKQNNMQSLMEEFKSCSDELRRLNE